MDMEARLSVAARGGEEIYPMRVFGVGQACLIPLPDRMISVL